MHELAVLIHIRINLNQRPLIKGLTAIGFDLRESLMILRLIAVVLWDARSLHLNPDLPLVIDLVLEQIHALLDSALEVVAVQVLLPVMKDDVRNQYLVLLAKKLIVDEFLFLFVKYLNGIIKLGQILHILEPQLNLLVSQMSIPLSLGAVVLVFGL